MQSAGRCPPLRLTERMIPRGLSTGPIPHLFPNIQLWGEKGRVCPILLPSDTYQFKRINLQGKTRICARGCGDCRKILIQTGVQFQTRQRTPLRTCRMPFPPAGNEKPTTSPFSCLGTGIPDQAVYGVLYLNQTV